MKYSLLLLLTVFYINAFAQVEAYINDEDGFSYVRKGQSTESKVISTLLDAEIFYCVPKRESKWWKIVKSNGISGYVHHSRIVPVSSQTVVIQRFFNKIEGSNPNDVEFGEVSNEQLFIYAERFPKSFLHAFDQTSPEVRTQLINELESPIHDLIDLELIYRRISQLKELEESRNQILDAIEVAGKKLNLKFTNE